MIAFLEPEGYLVTRFVEGEVGHPDPIQAARLLRRFHDGPPIAGRFDSFRVVEAYAAIAVDARRAATGRAYTGANALADRIRAPRRGYALRPCHNDLLNANFIDDGERLWIVDWEYAGMGDAVLRPRPTSRSTTSSTRTATDALLDAYGGGDLEALVLMRFMSDFREAMWGVVQQALSELEFDFGAYAEEHFERLERTAAEPRFRSALEH